MSDAAVPAENPAALIDDVAGFTGIGPQPSDKRRIGPLRHKANVLAVRLGRYRQRELARQRAGLVLAQAPEREAQEVEFLKGDAVEEIALVAGRIASPMQLRPVRPGHAAGVVAGGERIGAEVLRRRQQVAELDALVAADARDRRLATAIAFGEILDHRNAKPRLVIEHVMRDAKPLGNARRVAHILAGAARALLRGCGAVV